MKALLAVTEIAQKWMVTTRCARRRLRNRDEALGRLMVRDGREPLRHFDGTLSGGLLIQFTEGGQYFADAEMAKRHFPALFRGEEPEDDPIIEIRDGVRELRQAAGETQIALSFVRDAVAERR